MPIPLIIAGLVAGVVGAAGHMSAKETNEEAYVVASDARRIYEQGKVSLEQKQENTESALLQLGYTKQNVLEGSINQFLLAYGRLKDIELSQSVGLNELSSFSIDQQDALRLQELSSIYKSSVSSAATGMVIALAASGSLPIVTGVLSTAGTALAAGEIGMAAGLAGSALSFGAAMTPLAAIAAPVLLFTGISSSIKADENLEKANVMYAEAEAAAEKMKIAETLCVAIADRAEMFDGLLNELNELFSSCTQILDSFTQKKVKKLKTDTIEAGQMTTEELKLVAVTRALAGAVKSIIDTPILTADGAIANETQVVYDDIHQKLPAFEHAVDEVRSSQYSVKIKALPVKCQESASRQGAKKSGFLDALGNVFAIVLAGLVQFWLVASQPFPVQAIVCACIVLLIMNHDTEIRIFKLVKYASQVALVVGSCILMYRYCQPLANYGLPIKIIVTIAIFVLTCIVTPRRGAHMGNIRRLALQLTQCLFFAACAILLFSLVRWIGLSNVISLIITEVAYGLFALSVMFSSSP